MGDVIQTARLTLNGIQISRIIGAMIVGDRELAKQHIADALTHANTESHLTFRASSISDRMLNAIVEDIRALPPTYLRQTFQYPYPSAKNEGIEQIALVDPLTDTR